MQVAYYQNIHVESFWGSFKAELVETVQFLTGKMRIISFSTILTEARAV
ncbi:hypothetical protein IC230_06390 [Spirosoma sp. BT704]|uniref:Uncharacterized protein n=1 Tax=Spirosoma validum TaxID=2771355 RepID=A0A927AZ32_9BACT|nr:hypothetical protein [Spirosoma validum]